MNVAPRKVDETSLAAMRVHLSYIDHLDGPSGPCKASISGADDRDVYFGTSATNLDSHWAFIDLLGKLGAV